jgi:hypothetical protein
MRTLALLLVLALSTLGIVQPTLADDALGAATHDGLSVGLDSQVPLLLAQSSSDTTSSGGSVHIPRGLIRLAILGAIGLFSAGTWFVRKLTGS